MIGDAEIKEMQEHIAEMEREIAAKKKALREAKYAGLRAAMQARKEADEAVKQELKELGITQPTSFGIPLDFHWKF
jgi:aspartate aminotransferase-like enzyme